MYLYILIRLNIYNERRVIFHKTTYLESIPKIYALASSISWTKKGRETAYSDSQNHEICLTTGDHFQDVL